MTNPRRTSGFTLVEVLLVIAILGILMGMVLPRMVGRQKQASIDATRLSIKGIEQACKLYAIDHDGEYPAGQHGLEALLRPTGTDKRSWRGPYLDAVPLDAWGHEFRIVSPGQHNRGGIDIESPGPDGNFNTDDDITNQFNGS